VGHLDLLRLWQRVLRRADLPLLYSQGYSPCPRLSLACPLPVGVTGEGELLEFYLREPALVDQVGCAISATLPRGLVLVRLEELAASLPSLASLVRWTMYEVEVPADRSADELTHSVATLLGMSSLPWRHQRDTGIRHYDLRPLVLGIEPVGPAGGAHMLRMRLRWDARGAGRPEQVVAALGLPPPIRVHRVQVGLAQSTQ